MYKTIFIIVLSLVSALCWAQKPIQFAMEATYPPFEYMDNNGQIVGFDVDVAKAICEQIKAECVFNNEPFSSLIPSLKLGKFDALISAIAITPEREKQVDFSMPYYAQTASFVAPKNTKIELNSMSLKGKTIGAQSGSTMETYLRKVYGGAVTVKTYASITDAFLDLKAGRVDLVLADTPVAVVWLKQPDASGYEVLGSQPVVDDVIFGKGFGIAVKKGNEALLTRLNAGIEQIKQNGTYASLKKKYF